MKTFESKIAGVTFEGRQKMLKGILKKYEANRSAGWEQFPVRLMPVPNAHDKHAVEVQVFSEPLNLWLTVGFLPARDYAGIPTKFNMAIGMLIKAGGHVEASFKFVAKAKEKELYYAVITIGCDTNV